VEFRLAIAGRGLLDDGEPFARRREPLLDPAGREARLGEGKEGMRPTEFGAGRAIGVDTRA